MAQDYDDDEDYEGFHYAPIDVECDRGYPLYKPEEEEMFFAFIHNMSDRERDLFLDGLYGKYSPTRKKGPRSPLPGPSGTQRSAPPRKPPPPPPPAASPCPTTPIRPPPRIRPLSIDPHSAPPKTRIPRHRQYSTPPPRLARPPLPISPSPRRSPRVSLPPCEYTQPEQPFTTTEIDVPASPALSDCLAEGSFSESLDELVQPGAINWDEPIPESDSVCETPARVLSPILSEGFAESPCPESLDELVPPGEMDWDEPVCEAPGRSVSPTYEDYLDEGPYSEQPGETNWGEPECETTLSESLKEFLKTVEDNYDECEGSFSESLDELVKPGAINWNERIPSPKKPGPLSPTTSQCLAEGSYSDSLNELVKPEPINWDEPVPECERTVIKSEPCSESESSWVGDDSFLGKDFGQYQEPNFDQTEYLFEPEGYWDKVLGPEPTTEEEKERQKELEEEKLNDIINDIYYPGFLDDAINGNVDFNKIIFDLSFGENQPIPDELPPEKEPLSLVEAFDKRVEKETGARKKRIKEKPPPPPPPITKTSEVPSDQGADRLNISGLSLIPETPMDRQIINREEIVLGGVNDIEIADLIRESPVNELTHAIDCLQKAEIMNDFDKSLQAAEEAYSNAPPDLAECAAIHKASTFKADDITKRTATIGGGGGSYKPIEIVSYMGITKPVY